MDNYRSLQTPNVCENGGVCTSSLRQYLKGLPAMFGNKRNYDRFRRDYVSLQSPEDRP
jgi:hypothetical protein